MTTPKSLMLTVALAAASLAACERNDNAPPKSNQPTATAPAERTTPPLDKTALGQSNRTEDLRITADVRRAIIDDKTMSTAAQNCTIVTRDGQVLLKGQVKSAQEKSAVEAKARGVSGVKGVNNELDIKSE